MNDGVRLNLRPFIEAGVLRNNPNVRGKEDRGRDPESASWYHVFKGERSNDHHRSLAEKRATREALVSQKGPRRTPHGGKAMTATQLARRVSALEHEVELLKKRLDSDAPSADSPWWEQEVGKFANDPIFDEIVRLGQKYRKAQRPPRRRTRR